jgi:hypothetical protein
MSIKTDISNGIEAAIVFQKEKTQDLMDSLLYSTRHSKKTKFQPSSNFSTK